MDGRTNSVLSNLSIGYAKPEYRLRQTFALWQFKNPGHVIGIGDGFSSRALRSSLANIPPEEAEVHHQAGNH